MKAKTMTVVLIILAVATIATFCVKRKKKIPKLAMKTLIFKIGTPWEKRLCVVEADCYDGECHWRTAKQRADNRYSSESIGDVTIDESAECDDNNPTNLNEIYKPAIEAKP